MSKEIKPEQVPWMMPHLTVKDVDTSMAFYESAFHFTRGMKLPGDNGKTEYADMGYQGKTLFMFGREGAYGNTCLAPATSYNEVPINLYVYCDDVDALFEHAKLQGAEAVADPEDMFRGDRMAQLKDPDGYRWSFATKVRDFVPPAT
ncbi:MAG: VOC family protein [Gammaproteobacteria bacterium]|nr:MAG: VOC family protein [Gammaproteobacteria bacterium]